MVWAFRDRVKKRSVSYVQEKCRNHFENSFKIRQRYEKYKDGMMRFQVLIWQINKLDGEELLDAIVERIAKDIKYLELQPCFA